MAGTCYLNGKAVGIGKEVCQADPNTTWVEGGGGLPEKKGWAENWMDQSTGKKLLDIGSNALLFGGPFGLGARAAMIGGKKLLAGGAMSSRTGKLMDRLFRKPGGTVFKEPVPGGGVIPGGQKFNPQMFNQTTKGGLPVQPKFGAYNAPYNRTAGRVMRDLVPGKRAAGVGVIGAGLGMGYAGGADERAQQQQQLQNLQLDQVMASQKAFDAKKSEEAATKAEADRVAGLNPMQRMMENLKNPEFLNESISGQPGDTRLNRLGQLMSYYGGTPKQRAAMGDPQKRFAEIESNVATNKAALAKAQATLQGKSPFGSLGTTGLAKGLESLVKERYPSTFGFGGIDDKDVEGVAARVASVMQQLAQENPFTASQPGGIEQIREAAFAQVEQELGL